MTLQPNDETALLKAPYGPEVSQNPLSLLALKDL